MRVSTAVCARSLASITEQPCDRAALREAMKTSSNPASERRDMRVLRLSRSNCNSRPRSPPIMRLLLLCKRIQTARRDSAHGLSRGFVGGDEFFDFSALLGIAVDLDRVLSGDLVFLAQESLLFVEPVGVLFLAFRCLDLGQHFVIDVLGFFALQF